MADSKISDLAAVTDVIASDEFVLARAGDTVKIDASDLAAGLMGGELAYAQITTPYSTTGTVEASATTVVTAPAITVDGSTSILIEFYAPYFSPNATLNAEILLNLWEASAGNLGRIAYKQTPAAAGSASPVHVSRILTPAAGTYTYSIRGWVTAGTGAIGAGAGGAAATYMPAFIRITSADAGGSGGGSTDPELAYAEFTSSVTVTATVEASPNNVVSAPAVTLDGSTRVKIEFYSPTVDTGTAASSYTVVNLWDGATDLGRIGGAGHTAASVGDGFPMKAERYLTPTAGSHTYSIKAWRINSDGAIHAATGGTGTNVPGYIRITKADLGAGGSSSDVTGWTESGETWAYASADDPTYTFTIAGVDRTARYTPGTRIRLTQATGGTKYFIVTKVAFSTDTTVTVYGGTDYDLANEAISIPKYSHQNGPEGFPLDPTKWTVKVTDTTDRSQASPTSMTWYNLGGVSIGIPIGAWNVDYQCTPYWSDASSVAAETKTTLSTANNSESDPELSVWGPYASPLAGLGATVYRAKQLVLAAKTSYFLSTRTEHSSIDGVDILGAAAPTIIRAVCAYLGGGGSAGGVVEPIGTSLPTSPADGQEFTLTDSITAPTYAWRFRYVSAKASNKWVFIGGSPLMAQSADGIPQSTTSTSYTDLATAGPAITLPVTGDYQVEVGCICDCNGAGVGSSMSYAIGGTAAVDADMGQATGDSSNSRMTIYRRKHKAGLGAVTLTTKYRNSDIAGTVRFYNRSIAATPVAVGG